MATIDHIRRVLADHRTRLLPVDDKYRAAVAVVLHEQTAGDLRILFIERTTRDGDPWSGHIAFPGGRMETGDAGPQETAERETQEELGIDLRSAGYIGRLDDLSAHIHPIKVSGFVYHIKNTDDFILSDEVRDAFWVPFRHLTDPARLTTYNGPDRDTEKLIPAIDLLGSGRPVLWGLTYRFVSQLVGFTGYELPPHDPGY